MEEPTLYVIPLSHPACTGRLMLEHKGIEHRVVTIVNGLHRPLLKAMGFRRGTVPALRLGDRKVEGTLEISRALDEMVAEPPLQPKEPQRRLRLEEVERWGEAELQPVPRRLFRWALNRHRRIRRDLAELNRLPLAALTAVAMKPVAAYYARLSGADGDAVRRDLARLPRLLDRIDAWIDDGTLGGADLHAADFQIVPSVRVLMNFEDLRGVLDGRPATELALRTLPEYPGRVPPVFPDGWLSPARPG